MAHVLDGTDLTPLNFSKLGLDMLRTKTALISRIYNEARPEQTAQGGNNFLIYPPTTTQAPEDFDSSTLDCTNVATHEINRNPIVGTWDKHKIIRLKWNLFESRLAIGNFESAYRWAFKGYIDGLVREIERDIAAMYVHAARFVGSNAGALDDATIRDGLVELSKENVEPDPSDVSMIVAPQTYWKDLLDEDRYALHSSAGDKAAMVQRGKLNDFYNLYWDFSPAIVGSYGSGGSTVHNMLFHRYALGISFKEFEPVSKYVDAVGQNVEEGQLTDPESNVTLRTQIYYDPKCKEFVLEIDVAYGVFPLMTGYLVDVRSASNT